MFIKRLGGVFYGLFANIHIQNTKRVFQIYHGDSAAVIYRETAMAREGHFLWEAEGRGKLPCHIDMVINGHWHYFQHIHSERQHLLRLPGWTDWMPFRKGMKLYGKVIPDIGGVIVLIDMNDRILVHHFLYPRPMIADGVIEEGSLDKYKGELITNSSSMCVTIPGVPEQVILTAEEVEI
jgi:hypothetical protein